MGTLKTGCYYYWGWYLDHGYRWREKKVTWTTRNLTRNLPFCICIVVQTSCCTEHLRSFLQQRSFNEKILISNHFSWALSMWEGDKYAQLLPPGCRICLAFAEALRRILNHAEQESQYLWYVSSICRLFLVHGGIYWSRLIERPRNRKMWIVLSKITFLPTHV